MRDDDDHFRHYVPLFRRLIILAVVLAAVPVILWTITAYVRSYVGVPRTPVYRPMAATTPTQSPPAAAATPQAVASQASVPPAPAVQQQPEAPNPLSPIVEARATTLDAREPPPLAKGPLASDRPSNNDADSLTDAPQVVEAATPAPPSDADAKAALSAAMRASHDGTAATTGAVAPQAETEQPATAPLPGPIPLPRHRPSLVAMAQTGVPLPRRRPETAGPPAPETNSGGPIGWIQNIFH